MIVKAAVLVVRDHERGLVPERRCTQVVIHKLHEPLALRHVVVGVLQQRTGKGAGMGVAVLPSGAHREAGGRAGRWKPLTRSLELVMPGTSK